jgi:hypothetical protein
MLALQAKETTATTAKNTAGTAVLLTGGTPVLRATTAKTSAGNSASPKATQSRDARVTLLKVLLRRKDLSRCGRGCYNQPTIMKVFLAGIMQGSLIEASIHDQSWRQRVTDALARHVPHAQVYCHFSRHPNSIAYDLPQIRATLAEGNLRAAQCDVLVAYLPSASMGTAIEMYEAARGQAAVLTITPLSHNWVVRAYSDRVLASFDEFERFLESGELEGLLAAKKRM